MNIDTAIFIISAVVAVFGATMMVFQRNPVASVLYLILSIVAQAVLYIQLGALFIGAILIIVYAGAVLVLFLFVIMMLNLRGGEDLGKPSPPLSQITKYFIALLIFAEMVFVVRSAFFRDAGPTGILTTPADQFGSVESVATLLFTRYLYPFELASILLLAAIVGAVVMARRESRSDKDIPGEVQK
jgi:NADH-quinone oxidoreductase subunit J